MLEHRGETRVGGGEALGDRRQRADRHTEHDVVEVLADLQHVLGRVRTALACLEGDVTQCGRTADELVVEGLRRPAHQPAGVGRERAVLGITDRLGLTAHVDAVDELAVGRDADVGDLAEELEAHAAGSQRLVDRREDGVAHPRLHLPHDRAAVAQAHAQHRLQRLAGGQAGLFAVTVAVGEAELVEGAQDRRLGQRLGAGAVARHPGHELLVVDLGEAALVEVVEVVGEDAAEDRRGDVEGHRVAAAVGDLPDDVGEQPQEPADQRLIADPVPAHLAVDVQHRTGEAQEGLEEILQLGVAVVAAEQLLEAEQEAVEELVQRLEAQRGVLGRLDEAQRADRVVHQPVQAGRLAGDPRDAVVAGEVEVPRDPAVVLGVVAEDDLVGRVEGVAPGAQRSVGGAVELLVDAADDVEGVLVEAEPDVEAVLLDALGGVGGSDLPAPAGALAAQPPAQLVDGDVVALAQLGRRCQLEGGGQTARSATKDRHSPPFAHPHEGRDRSGRRRRTQPLADQDHNAVDRSCAPVNAVPSR